MDFEKWFSAYEEHLYNLKGVSRLPTQRERFHECWQASRQQALEEALRETCDARIIPYSDAEADAHEKWNDACETIAQKLRAMKKEWQ